MDSNQKNKFWAIVVFIIVVIVTTSIIMLIALGIQWLQSRFNIPESNKPIDQNEQIVKPSKYPDFDFYSDLKKLQLAQDTDSWVNEGSIEGRQIKKFIKATGNISNAYLFANISVDNGKPLKVWDSIYVSLRRELNGYLYQPLDGHLLRIKSLAIPDSDTTRLLYDLRQIPFTTIPYSDTNSFVNKNWLSLIQNNQKFQFETFLSTSRSGGKIIDISIGYQCTEQTPDCKLEIVE